MNAILHKLSRRIAAIMLGAVVAMPAAFADDIEIYNNPEDNPLRPPMTILVLDLNLLGICNNVVTNSVNPANPDAPQLCLNLTNSALLNDVLSGLSPNPAGLLSSLLSGSGMNAPALCNLYGVLGLASPVIPLPAVSGLLSILLGGVSTLSCSTLNFLSGIPLAGSMLNSLMPSFVGQLVQGLVNPLLSTVVGQLPAAVTGVLNTTLGGVLSAGQTGLVSLLEAILNNLVNSRVAIVLSHGDRSAANGAPASGCGFGDQASIPTSRRETVNCSNGAYFFLGFTPLVDQGAVNALLSQVTARLSNLLNPATLTNSISAIASSALTNPTSLLPPYQGKEVYVEIANYLTGGNVYNAPLDRWDGLTGLLGRDTSIESGSRYIQPPAQCDTVNVLNVQVTNSVRDNESNAELRRIYPGAEVAGSFALADVVAQAEDPGIFDAGGNVISLRSRFLIQENLSSVAALTTLGPNVTTYANNLGLLGLGQTVAEFLKPVLEVDASLLTPSNSADPLSPGQIRPEAFFGSFRPAPDQGPRWNGNLKKLEVRADTDGNLQYFDSRNASAIAADGRIKTGALSYWTLPALLGSASGDGRSATLGGAGQRIPGYQVNGGGAPGRVNGSGARKLFFDRYNTDRVPSLAALDADDVNVRNELRTSLGAANDAQAQQLLLYARGYEVGTTAAPLNVSGTLGGRPWLHGAVLHSRPVAVNYGARGSYSAENPDIRLLYGATDGYLRMVSNTTSAGAQSGVESLGIHAAGGHGAAEGPARQPDHSRFPLRCGRRADRGPARSQSQRRAGRWQDRIRQCQ